MEEELKQLAEKLLQKTEKIALQYSMKAFKTSSWDGKAWEKRKASSQNRNDRRNKDKPRALLVRSGNLRRSVIVTSRNGQVIIMSDMPYSEIQNEGGVINHPGGTPYTFGKDGKSRFISRKKADELEVKAQMRRTKNSQITNTRRFRVTKPHKIEIPKRQYIGQSEELETEIENMIYKELEKLFLKDIK